MEQQSFHLLQASPDQACVVATWEDTIYGLIRAWEVLKKMSRGQIERRRRTN